MKNSSRYCVSILLWIESGGCHNLGSLSIILTGRSGPARTARIGRRCAVILKQIGVILLQSLQSVLDIRVLIGRLLQLLDIQQCGNSLGIAALGGGDGLFDLSIKRHSVQFVLPLLVFGGELGIEGLDLVLQILHVNALERLQAILSGLQLLLDRLVVGERLLRGLDITAILRHDRVDQILAQCLVADLQIFQKFTLHCFLLSPLRFRYAGRLRCGRP